MYVYWTQRTRYKKYLRRPSKNQILTKHFFFLVQETSLGDDIWPKLKAYVISGPQQVD